MGTLTRAGYPWLTKKYKEKVADEALKDDVREQDRNMQLTVRTCPLADVDNGEKFTFDMRENPERGGFPRGDSRRW